MKVLYVGNLPFSTTEEDLKQQFSEFGSVQSVRIVRHHDSGKSKGFGFVTMDDDAAAQKAIDGTNGKEIDGRPLRVNEAREKTEGPRRDAPL